MSKDPKPGTMTTERVKSQPETEQVPEWLSTRLRDLYTEIAEEPLPAELLALVRRLEEKDGGG